MECRYASPRDITTGNDKFRENSTIHPHPLGFVVADGPWSPIARVGVGMKIKFRVF